MWWERGVEILKNKTIDKCSEISFLYFCSEGNLATKQVVFLQRPVMWTPVPQTPEVRMMTWRGMKANSRILMWIKSGSL